MTIGDFAAVLSGYPTMRHVLEICHDTSPANLDKMRSALAALGADFDVPLASGESSMYETTAGMLDCHAVPAGTTGYADLAKNAVAFVIEDVDVRVAALDDLLRIRRADTAPVDQIAAEILSDLSRGPKPPGRFNPET